jgi:hypothetical protein
MAPWQLLLELILVVLLAVTLFHALRLERALGIVRRDRAELEAMLQAFNQSTEQAQLATERLRDAASGGGKQISQLIESAANLRDDLVALTDRGERLADRMDHLVRAGRDVEPRHVRAPTADPALAVSPRPRSQAERDLIRALKVVR